MDRSRIKGAGRSVGWLRGGSLWTAVAGLVALASGGIALSADAASTHPSQITACYKTDVNPTDIKILTAGRNECPRRYQMITWNAAGVQGPAGPAGPAGAPGAQGPAGLSTGGTVSSSTPVPLDVGQYVPVLRGAPVPTNGVYYLSASLTLNVGATRTVSCEFASPQPTVEETSAPPQIPLVLNMSLTGANILSAGQIPTVLCEDTDTSGGHSQFLQGNLNEVLISNSHGTFTSGPAAAAQQPTPHHRKGGRVGGSLRR